MALIRRAETEQGIHSPFALDLEDLRKRAEQLKAAAADEAAKIIADAKAERARLIEGAEAQGREDGHAQGLEEGRREGAEQGRREAIEAVQKDSAALIESWTKALGAFARTRDDLHRAARHDVVELACRIATLVTKRVVDLDASVVEAQLGEVLTLAGAGTRLRLRVHPDDVESAKHVLPSLIDAIGSSTHAELVEDATLTRGSCVASSDDGGELDASIDGQLARLVEVLMPSPEGRTGTLGDAA